MPEKEINEPIVPTHEFPEENDMQAFRDNPRNSCEGMQKKYIGKTFAEYQEYWESIKDYDGPVGEYKELVDKTFTNVYTKEKKIISELVEIPKPSPDEIIEEKKRELKLKLVNGTITDEEKEMLKLLAI